MLNSRKLNAKKNNNKEESSTGCDRGGGISIAVLYQEKTEGKIGEHK